MLNPRSESELSPLDQIRQTEAEMNRAIAAARQAAEQVIAEAEQQALELKRQAKEAGVQDGIARYRAMMAGAEQEACAVAAEAQVHAQELQRKGLVLMESGVRHALEVVIGLPEEANHK